MEVIKSYKDLCNEIEIWKERLRTYEIQLKTIMKLAKLEGPGDVKGIDYTQPYVKGTSQLGFEEAIKMLQKIESHIYLHREAIENMEKHKKNIEERVKKLKGIDYKVVYMRDIEGKSLVEIAEELGYSYNYIKEVSARNKRTHFYPTDN